MKRVTHASSVALLTAGARFLFTIGPLTRCRDARVRRAAGLVCAVRRRVAVRIVVVLPPCGQGCHRLAGALDESSCCSAFRPAAIGVPSGARFPACAGNLATQRVHVGGDDLLMMPYQIDLLQNLC